MGIRVISIQVDQGSGDVLEGWQVALSKGNDTIYAAVSAGDKTLDAIVGGATQNRAFVGRYTATGQQLWLYRDASAKVSFRRQTI